MLRKLFNRRKHPRFFAEKKTYIVFQSNTQNQRKLQIIDISQGGCGFIYHGDETIIDKVSRVDLMSENVPYVENIFISVKTDEPAEGDFRRRGVEFKWLGSVSEQTLKTFIEKVSICKR